MLAFESFASACFCCSDLVCGAVESCSCETDPTPGAGGTDGMLVDDAFDDFRRPTGTLEGFATDNARLLLPERLALSFAEGVAPNWENGKSSEIVLGETADPFVMDVVFKDTLA